MEDIARRTLLAGCAASAASLVLPSPLKAQSGGLTGAGQASIERYLTLQEGTLQENTTAHDLLVLHTAPRTPVSTTDRLLMWNEISLAANALDYVPPLDNSHNFHYQFGPHRSSRAIAVVQLAVFEAVNATTLRYKSFAGFTTASRNASLDAAIAYASHDALAIQYPAQQSRLDSILADDLTRITGSPKDIAAGRDLGRAALAAVMAKLGNDNTGLPEPSIPAGYQPSHAPGEWDVDPISGILVALGANWGKVNPFTFTDQAMFRPPVPPALGSKQYSLAFAKTKALGGDPQKGTHTIRTASQTFIAKFWSYDGTPGLCAPPRLFNQIARQLLLSRNIGDLSAMARALAIVNIAMADAAVSAWEAKYHYKYWRPVTAIRYPKVPNGDPAWYPIGAQATNTAGPNITPPFPAYPSGHATFGGALFEVLRSFMPDATPFSFVSDEFNGKNKDVYGYIRPRQVAHFTSLTNAEKDCAESRIYDGVHWQFDGDMGIDQGRKVGRQVLATFAIKA